MGEVELWRQMVEEKGQESALGRISQAMVRSLDFNLVAKGEELESFKQERYTIS